MVNKKLQIGEISTILTIGMLIFMGITALSSSLILKNKNKSQPKAAVSTEQCRNDIKEGDPCEEVGAENWCIKCNEPRIKGPCNNGDGGVGFPFKCIQTDEGLKWKEQNSLGECNLTCTAPEQQAITNENSPSCQDAANPARADQTPSGYTWQAICGKNCNGDADCDPGANGARWCYGFKEGNKCLKLVQLNSTGTGGDCNDNPAGPPVDPKHPEAKYKWTALCNEKACTDSKQCPIGANNAEGWCYGFGRSSADWRCLRMDQVSTGTVAMTSSCKTLYDKIIASTTNGNTAANCSNSKYDPVADLNKDKKADSEDLNLFNSTANLGQNDGQCAAYLNATNNPCQSAVSQQPAQQTPQQPINTQAPAQQSAAGSGAGSSSGGQVPAATAVPVIKIYTYTITGKLVNINNPNIGVPSDIWVEIHKYENENDLIFDFDVDMGEFTKETNNDFKVINKITTPNSSTPPTRCSLIILIHGKRLNGFGPFDCEPNTSNGIGDIDIGYNPLDNSKANVFKAHGTITNNNTNGNLKGLKLNFDFFQADMISNPNFDINQMTGTFTITSEVNSGRLKDIEECQIFVRDVNKIIGFSDRIANCQPNKDYEKNIIIPDFSKNNLTCTKVLCSDKDRDGKEVYYYQGSFDLKYYISETECKDKISPHFESADICPKQPAVGGAKPLASIPSGELGGKCIQKPNPSSGIAEDACIGYNLICEDHKCVKESKSIQIKVSTENINQISDKYGIEYAILYSQGGEKAILTRSFTGLIGQAKKDDLQNESLGELIFKRGENYNGVGIRACIIVCEITNSGMCTNSPRKYLCSNEDNNGSEFHPIYFDVDENQPMTFKININQKQ